MGGTGGLLQAHPGRGLRKVDRAGAAGMVRLLPGWGMSSEFGKGGRAHCSVGCRLRQTTAARWSWELGWPWAAVTPRALLPFLCRRSQERVSVHPHRLHPSFDFGHQLQTPQPRYLAEGTDW